MSAMPNPLRPRAAVADEPLVTPAQRTLMLANGARSAAGDDIDPWPVVRLFTPDAGAAWLLAELDPDDPDVAFGLCDLGLGFPELGTVRLSKIATVRGRLGLPVECDGTFVPDRPVSAYAREARLAADNLGPGGCDE